MKPNERQILILMAAVNFTHILDFMIMMPLGNYLMPYFNISAKQFSFLVGAYTLSAAVSGFGAAFFVDHFDRKKVLVISYTGFIAGTLACAVAPTYILLLASRTLAGLFGGLIGAQVLSIIADIFSYEKRGAAMGSVMSAFAIASTLGVPFSLYLANLFSWHAPFILVGVIGLALIPLLYRFVPNMTGHIQQKKTNPFQTLLQVLDNKQLRLALLFSALMMIGHFLIIPFINPFMEFNQGYSKAETPMVYLVGGVASFFAANVLGKMADRIGKLRVFSVSILLSLLLVWLITNLPAWHFALVLGLFAIWFSLSTGRMVSAQAMISNLVPPAQRGSFMSFNSSVQQLGTSVASFIAGLVVTNDATGRISHFSWLGYLSILVLFACFLLARYLFGRMDKNEPLFAAPDLSLE